MTQDWCCALGLEVPVPTLVQPVAKLCCEPGRGAYYDRMWRNALHASPNGITITSYNEWGEGTQIEGARPHTSRNGSRAYADYTPDGPQFYMKRTKEWVEQAKRGCEAASLRQERVEL